LFHYSRKKSYKNLATVLDPARVVPEISIKSGGLISLSWLNLCILFNYFFKRFNFFVFLLIAMVNTFKLFLSKSSNFKSINLFTIMLTSFGSFYSKNPNTLTLSSLVSKFFTISCNLMSYSIIREIWSDVVIVFNILVFNSYVVGGPYFNCISQMIGRNVLSLVFNLIPILIMIFLFWPFNSGLIDVINLLCLPLHNI